MRTIAIVGGKLQATEACYLARHAGIRSTVIDIDPDAPARGMCDEFVCGNVIAEDPQVLDALNKADMVLPAMENDAVLEKLVQLSERDGFILAFDMGAYRISESKHRSDALFHRLGVPAPRYYPEGDFPFFAKEDGGSGSHGARRLDTQEEMDAYLKTAAKDAVIQECIEGPSYSVEIIGKPGNYRLYEITQIHVDDGFDCNLVTTPCEELTEEQKEGFLADAVRIAEEMQLSGIMDYECILHDGQMKMLEIDARIPSQTPAAVLAATGMNELEDLYDLFCHGDFRKDPGSKGWHAAYEHYLCSRGSMQSLGEHIMTEGGVLTLKEGFCESDETQTDYEEGSDVFRVTFINSAGSKEELEHKRKKVAQCLQNLQRPRNED